MLMSERSVTHNWPAAAYTLPILLLSTLYNMPKFFELEVLTIPAKHLNLTEPGFEYVHLIHPTSLRLDSLYISAYLVWANFFINGAIPFLVLILLNGWVVAELRRQNSRLATAWLSNYRAKELKLSQVSLVITVIFVLCHSVKWVPNVWELRQVGSEASRQGGEWPEWLQVTTHFSHLLTTLNGSTSVYIYLVKHRKDLRGTSFSWLIRRSRRQRVAADQIQTTAV